jgi:hypothetical protein
MFSYKTAWQALGSILLGLSFAATPANAQVSSQEVVNLELRNVTTEYFQKLITLNRQIISQKYPFPFQLSRYIGLDPKSQAAGDTRGLEFVRFHDRTILKCSGNYNAAFGTDKFTRNQRADRVFSDVVVPMLRLLPDYFKEPADFEGIGFEISYHVRELRGKVDYEGRENLVVVLPVADALHYAEAATLEAQQSIVSTAEVYVSGERWGLALGKPDGVPVEKPRNGERASEQTQKPSGASSFLSSGRTTNLNLRASPASTAHAPDEARVQPPPASPAPPALTPAEVDAAQTKFQFKLDEFGTQLTSVFHQKAASNPELTLFRESLHLQLTLNNPEAFDKEKTSLYKRAALSFDTFLAPHLADIVSKLPAIPDLAGLDITVLEKVSASAQASEAVEFICPLPALRSFAAFEITNQELINRSVVLVNGVRISLNLQQVE